MKKIIGLLCLVSSIASADEFSDATKKFLGTLVNQKITLQPNEVNVSLTDKTGTFTISRPVDVQKGQNQIRMKFDRVFTKDNRSNILAIVQSRDLAVVCVPAGLTLTCAPEDHEHLGRYTLFINLIDLIFVEQMQGTDHRGIITFVYTGKFIF